MTLVTLVTLVSPVVRRLLRPFARAGLGGRAVGCERGLALESDRGRCDRRRGATGCRLRALWHRPTDDLRFGGPRDSRPVERRGRPVRAAARSAVPRATEPKIISRAMP